MNYIGRVMLSVAAFVVGVSLLVAAVWMCAGCGSAQAQSDIAAWTADDGVCVQSGRTRAEIDACRDSMREFFCAPDGGQLADTGACEHVRLSSGRAP